MTPTDILTIRLYNQLLTGCKFTCPSEIVSWLGAMQSQNYEMAKWGIGVRLPGTTNKQIEEAFNAGEILRTHILRPTWHFITPEDIHWMLELTAPRMKPAFDSFARQRGFEMHIAHKAQDMVAAILEEHGHLTRQEMIGHLAERGIHLSEDHNANYIMSRAEVDGLVCSGKVKGTKHTYALLYQRAPHKVSLCKEEMLEKLARKYFASHGPATLEDYFWWSGLNMTDAKKGIELIKQDFICEEINGKVYWMPNDIQTPSGNVAHLLPAFDEYVVSYKYREEMIDERYYRKVLTMNGIFSPTIHYNGKAVGSWKRITNKNGAVAELTFFETTPKKVHARFNKQLRAYERFNMK